MRKIISVVGARPNFMKVAPLHFEFQKYQHLLTHLICHTGQHYDEKMSKIFFEELGLPKPDFFLGVGSGSHAVQTAGIMVEFEKVLIKEKPDLVIVVGDVNSTVACSLVAKKMNIKVAHVEAGLRSFDTSMPEEINRILTDAISDYMFVSESSGITNLTREGVDSRKMFLVGNIMIDSLVHNQNKIDRSTILDRLNLQRGKYIVVTLHRPSNVDDKNSLSGIINLLNKYAENYKIIFPIHPRTMANIEKFGLQKEISQNIILMEPIGYIDFVNLVKNSRLVITDSGGIQEEATFLYIQCITLRENTERPATAELGTNTLIGTNIDKINGAIDTILTGRHKEGSIPPFWDGKTAERICKIIVDKIIDVRKPLPAMNESI
jgi:UDP-N-acetylglucosamine 2-epimerase (non-hydrolysing)